MVHLDEEVVGGVVVEQVAGDARALRHPVHPQAAAGVVDAVVPDQHVDGGVELDAAHLRAGELPLGPDVVDVVVRDLAEDRAEAAGDAGLLAVEDGVVPDDVGADLLARPADLQRAHDHLVVVGGAVLGGIVDPDVVAGRRDPCPG